METVNDILLLHPSEKEIQELNLDVMDTSSEKESSTSWADLKDESTSALELANYYASELSKYYTTAVTSSVTSELAKYYTPPVKCSPAFVCSSTQYFYDYQHWGLAVNQKSPSYYLDVSQYDAQKIYGSFTLVSKSLQPRMITYEIEDNMIVETSYFEIGSVKKHFRISHRIVEKELAEKGYVDARTLIQMCNLQTICLYGLIVRKMTKYQLGCLAPTTYSYLSDNKGFLTGVFPSAYYTNDVQYLVMSLAIGKYFERKERMQDNDERCFRRRSRRLNEG